MSEPKFKVGDKVVVLQKRFDVEPGTVATITSRNPALTFGETFFYRTDQDCGFFERNLQKIDPGPIREGDTVRIVIEGPWSDFGEDYFEGEQDSERDKFFSDVTDKVTLEIIERAPVPEPVPEVIHFKPGQIVRFKDPIPGTEKATFALGRAGFVNRYGDFKEYDRAGVLPLNEFTSVRFELVPVR